MATEPAICVTDLTCHYGNHPVLSGVTLQANRGELLAVMGPNGAGKSTLLAAMAGVVPAVRGSVKIHGHERRKTEAEELAARQVSVYLPAEPYLAGVETAREWVVVCGRLWGVADARLMDHATRLLELFDLGKGDKPISSASTGQRKKIALAGVLATDAPVMILDEPFAGGLDPSGILALRRVLKRLAEDDQRTIVMAQPVPELVEGLADRVAILGDGGLAVIDTVEGVKRAADVPPSASLDEAYENLVRPATLEHIANYLDAEAER